MNTEAAATTRFSSAPGRAAPPRPRRLWQAPVFVLGILALAGVILTRPPWRPVDGERAERDLAAARRLLDQPEPSRDQLLAMAERLLAHRERVPQRAAEIHFLTGSCYLRLASGDSAGEAAAKARRHLEEAAGLGAPAGERQRLTYRLGKALHLSGGDPRLVIDYLSRSIDKAADDPFEGYGMLAQAYLNLPGPDLEGALHANEKQLLQLDIDDDKLLAPVRLQRGELLLRLQKPDEARRVLANLGAGAPAGIQAQARWLRARSFQEEENWEEAAALWKEVLEDRNRAPRDPGWPLYYLGVCYRQLDQPADAARAWAECAARGDGGGEAVAAALGLAEVRLQEGSPEALEALERAVRDVTGPADWPGKLVDLDQARALFERACAVYRSSGDHERAMRLARLYEKLAPPGASQLLRAQAAEAGAKARRDEEARALFRQAGEAYEQSAGLAERKADQLERLWLSADRYRQAGEAACTVAVLQRLLEQEEDKNRLGEGWFRLAEAHGLLKNEAFARTAYRQCIVYETPFAYRARYQLALMDIGGGEMDEAVAALEQNLKLLAFDPDPEAEEKTLYTLAHLLFQGRQYLMAVARLDQALRGYPDSPDALRGRFELAECHRLLANQDAENLRLQGSSAEDAQKHFKEQYDRRLGLAAYHYQELIGTLNQRPPKDRTAEEQRYYRQALFGSAEARFYLGQWDNAIILYEQMANHGVKRVEEVYALSKVLLCRQLRRAQALKDHDPDAARRAARQEEELLHAALGRFQTALQALDDKAFEGDASTRQDWERLLQSWEKWLADVRRP